MNILLDLLFPPRCAFCGALTDRPGVCPDCQLPRIPPDKVLRPVGERGYLCAVALYYDGPVQTGVRALKFEGKSWRTEVFAQYIVQAAAEHLSGAFDAVTYVPVSPRRKFVRGYDQAQLLARAAAKIWDVRAEQTLRKIRHNQAQSSLTRPEDRRENVKNAYAVPRPERVAAAGSCSSTMCAPPAAPSLPAPTRSWTRAPGRWSAPPWRGATARILENS